ncbi:MAG: SOS response-associated peptidase [Acidobacteriaceae bacterium]
MSASPVPSTCSGLRITGVVRHPHRHALLPLHAWGNGSCERFRQQYPSWHKDPKHLGVLAINAQAESLMEKPMWRRALQKRRCLIPADGFYEWQKLDAKNKQPYAFGMKSGEPFAFAGLWERWMAPDGKPLDSFAIITTDPNEVAAKVHTRMPVIVEPRDYTRWLTVEQEAQPPVDLLRPYDAEAMKAWKVGSAVGNVRNNDPSLCEEVS